MESVPLPWASLSPWTWLSVPVPLVLFVLWLRARDNEDEDAARKIFLAGMIYVMILAAGFPIVALLVCAVIVLWAIGAVDAFVQTPIAKSAAPPPIANQSPSEHLDGSVTRDTSSVGVPSGMSAKWECGAHGVSFNRFENGYVCAFCGKPCQPEITQANQNSGIRLVEPSWRDELAKELKALGCKFDGSYVELPSGARRLAVSNFDLSDLVEELKESDQSGRDSNPP
jgi:hypothetical protein